MAVYKGHTHPAATLQAVTEVNCSRQCVQCVLLVYCHGVQRTAIKRRFATVTNVQGGSIKSKLLYCVNSLLFFEPPCTSGVFSLFFPVLVGVFCLLTASHISQAQDFHVRFLTAVQWLRPD